ncbi:unnamed protein product [Orchesella dallaii]|uniref:Uncharacterized protein n=1 Tax=Orchesella dallaii TaxID=48710 RepID=A0ABP1R691_9HEXA
MNMNLSVTCRKVGEQSLSREQNHVPDQGNKLKKSKVCLKKNPWHLVNVKSTYSNSSVSSRGKKISDLPEPPLPSPGEGKRPRYVSYFDHVATNNTTWLKVSNPSTARPLPNLISLTSNLVDTSMKVTARNLQSPSSSSATKVTPKIPNVYNNIEKQSAHLKLPNYRHPNELAVKKPGAEEEFIMQRVKEEPDDVKSESASERREKVQQVRMNQQLSATYNAIKIKTISNPVTLPNVPTSWAPNKASSEQRKTIELVKSDEQIEKTWATNRACYHRRMSMGVEEKHMITEEEKERERAISKAGYYIRKRLQSKEEKERKLAVERANYHRKKRLQSNEERERKLAIRRAYYQRRKENGQLKPRTSRKREETL